MIHNLDGVTSNFEFLRIEDASLNFDAENVQALRLKQRMYGDEWEFTALHSPEWDNVLLLGNESMNKDEMAEQSVAAFCYLSVILK